MQREHLFPPGARRALALAGPLSHPPGPPGVAGVAGLLCLLSLLGVWASPAQAASPSPAPPARLWPVPGQDAGHGTGGPPRIERAFQPPPTPWAAGHRGVDLAARAGQPVRAVAAGRVAFAGRVAGRGVVTLTLSDPTRTEGSADTEDAGGALRTTYEPVRASVTTGEDVAAGQVIGVLERGPYHCARACLHWGLLRGDRYVDPLSLLPGVPRGPSRLLPVFGVPLPEQRTARWERAHRHAPAEPVGSSAAPAPSAAVATALVLVAGAAWARRGLYRREAAGSVPGKPGRTTAQSRFQRGRARARRRAAVSRAPPAAPGTPPPA